MMASKLRIGVLAVVGIVAIGAVAWSQFPSSPKTPPLSAQEAAKLNAWSFRLTAIDGAPMPMAQYKGKVVLLVNTASKCGFTPQYDGLQQVQDSYAPKGFTVVGVPSGDFMGQELKTNSEIAGFCKARKVKFPLAEKSDVVGPNAIPIYRWAVTELGQESRPQWNFHKYLIGRDGKLIAAFGTRVDPNDPKVRTAIEMALKAPATA